MNEVWLNKTRLIYYLILWVFVAVIYTITALFYYKVPFVPGLIDGLLYNLLLFGLGLSLWFAIRYMDIGIKNLIELVLAHLLTATAGTFIVLFSVNALTRNLSNQYDIFQTLILWKAMTGYFMYSLLTLIYYVLKFTDRIEEKNQVEKELKSLLHETELNLLKTQLNPHFIFNSLNSISSLTLSDPGAARDMVIKLSDFLRFSLGKEKSEWVTLEEEINNTRLFLDIETVRFGDRLQVSVLLEKEIKKAKVPIMILQPLVENAVKFGMYDVLEKAPISIACGGDTEVVEIIITNTIESPVNVSGEGIGLENVRRRLALMYQERATMEVESGRQLFKVVLRLPRI